MSAISFLETGVIYCDDNLHRLAQFPEDCIDLIYLDPPFFSNRNYEVIWGDEAEVRSFEDRWEGGVHVYKEWMRDRVFEMRRVLRPTGSIYLHCDWHAGHYLKVMLDEVFGVNNFQNEIVWHYQTGGASKKRYARKHDTIFFYSKTADFKFYPDRIPIPRTEKAMERAQNPKGARISADDDTKLPHDVFIIQALNPMARERLGYPTQKPEALLEPIILASSNAGDIVLDPFAGCGTTLVVAQRLKRHWIGIDISPTAVGLMKWRMRKVGYDETKLVGMPVTEDQLKALKPFEFQNWVIQQVHGTHSPRKSGDMGVDGYSFLAHNPIQVKQSESVGRNVVDNFETAVDRSGKSKGVIYAFSFTKGAYEEVARAKNAKKLEIELIAVSDLLEDADLVTPTTADEPSLFPGDELPPARSKDDRPSAEELVESDKGVRPAAKD